MIILNLLWFLKIPNWYSISLLSIKHVSQLIEAEILWSRLMVSNYYFLHAPLPLKNMSTNIPIYVYIVILIVYTPTTVLIYSVHRWKFFKGDMKININLSSNFFLLCPYGLYLLASLFSPPTSNKNKMGSYLRVHQGI